MFQYEFVVCLEKLAKVIFYADDALPKTSISIISSYFTTTDQTNQQYYEENKPTDTFCCIYRPSKKTLRYLGSSNLQDAP